jgi:hypothetical protein
MFTKIVLFAVFAACGVRADQATSSDVPLGGDPHENAKAAAAAQDWHERQMQMQMQASDRAAAPDHPTDKQPPQEDHPMDQHFCCQSVDHKTFSGNGCQLITELQVALCNKVLYCEGNWVKDDDKVFCE